LKKLFDGSNVRSISKRDFFGLFLERLFSGRLSSVQTTANVRIRSTYVALQKTRASDLNESRIPPEDGVALPHHHHDFACDIAGCRQTCRSYPIFVQVALTGLWGAHE
jgi:hypothetical protein